MVLMQAVLCAGLGLALATAVLCAAGRRLRRAGFWLSLATAGALAALAWGLHARLTGQPLPFAAVVLSALAVTAVVATAQRHWNPIGHTAFAAVLIAALLFLAYAGTAVPEARLGPWSLSLALLLLGLQAGVLALLVAHTFEIVDVVCRIRWERAGGPKVVPGYAPKVSFHVPIHDEPPDLVIETLDALARIAYRDYEVLVVDNNTPDERTWRPVQAHCARLGRRFRFFHLSPWPGYKSGALNFALAETAPDAELIGVVDADYHVEPNYPADLVGHFADPRVAFVQTPQDYRDGQERGRYGRALYLAYHYFFAVSMAARSERNAIIYAGTMGLIRRSALEMIGGWDEWCITEDAEASLRLLDAGFESVYVDRSYGRGLMPLDYAGLKKQRFRWAFGGMQILRRHAARLLGLRSGGKLTVSQRLLYLSGGLQWLNDPLTFAFTVLLLIGSSALLAGRPLAMQPLEGGAMEMPLLFILFAVMRFLWAFRARTRCTWREAADALTILLGLTWVVTAACVHGLVRRRGVFLRTPKQGDRPTLGESVRAVRGELLLGGACLGTALAMVADRAVQPLSTRGTIIVVLLWQAATYLSAVRTAIWNRRERLERAAARPVDTRRRLSPPPPPPPGARTVRWTATAAALVAMALVPSTAAAQELIAGWEGQASRGYAFASPVLSLRLSSKQALVLRGAASYLYYGFPDSTGRTDVTSPGASGALAYRLHSSRVNATLAAGYEVRWTERRSAAGASSRLTERGLVSQGEVFVQADPLTNVNAIVSYGHANRYVWARGGVKRQLTNARFTEPAALSVGAELTAQGNHDGHAYQAGGLLALDFFRARASLQVRGGYAQLQYPAGPSESKPYMGVGVYRAF